VREFLTREIEGLVLTTLRLHNQPQQDPCQSLRDALGGEFVKTALGQPQTASQKTCDIAL
jgi:hypothetical protein